MNNQTVYWVWLQQALGYAGNKILDVLSRYTFAEDFYRSSLSDKLSCGYWSASEREALADLSLEKAVGIINRCSECGIDIVTVGDVNYPEQLSSIAAPPIVLYTKGDISAVNSGLAIAIVGTRSATEYGRHTAFRFGCDLARNGVTVVSGGALGIDSCAHKGAVQAGGKTVCVLGCGLEYEYLKSNKDLRSVIAKNGLLVSEYPPDYPATRFTFPARNRLISGLSRGVLVVEAGERSGSLITANLALEQGRDVFSIPGSITSSVSQGTNKLIKLGAKAVTDVTDILSEYCGDEVFVQRMSPSDYYPAEDVFIEKKNNVSGNKRRKITKTNEQDVPDFEGTADDKSAVIREEDFRELSENAQKVIKLFIKEKKLHVDSIAEKTGLPIGVVHAALTELEMNDFIMSVQGRMYELVL